MLVELWEWDTIIGDSYVRKLDVCVAPHRDLRAVIFSPLIFSDWHDRLRRKVETDGSLFNLLSNARPAHSL